jgi:hypothetical protein
VSDGGNIKPSYKQELFDNGIEFEEGQAYGRKDIVG